MYVKFDNLKGPDSLQWVPMDHKILDAESPYISISLLNDHESEATLIKWLQLKL